QVPAPIAATADATVIGTRSTGPDLDGSVTGVRGLCRLHAGDVLGLLKHVVDGPLAVVRVEIDRHRFLPAIDREVVGGIVVDERAPGAGRIATVGVFHFRDRGTEISK